MSRPYILVVVTVPTKQEAEKISTRLLNEKLIACANILGPVSSHFHWSGKIEQAEEFMVFMKSSLDLFDTLENRIKALHSYEVPEILALLVTTGSKAYLEWLDRSLE